MIAIHSNMNHGFLGTILAEKAKNVLFQHSKMQKSDTLDAVESKPSPWATWNQYMSCVHISLWYRSAKKHSRPEFSPKKKILKKFFFSKIAKKISLFFSKFFSFRYGVIMCYYVIKCSKHHIWKKKKLKKMKIFAIFCDFFIFNFFSGENLGLPCFFALLDHREICTHGIFGFQVAQGPGLDSTASSVSLFCIFECWKRVIVKICQFMHYLARLSVSEAPIIG